MQVRIKRIDPTLPLPEYHTPGSVAFDLYARETTEIQPGMLARVPANVVVETPHGYLLAVVSRSSTPGKKGLSTPHGIGIIDQDYCGEQDEISLQVYNFTDHPVTVARGERIGQAAFVPVERAEWQEVSAMNTESRGGFGSTGSSV